MMSPPPKLRELAIASQARAAEVLRERPDYWHVISIREPSNPTPILEGARSVHIATFEDVLNSKGLHGLGPRSAHLESILRAAAPLKKAPLLVHCWAGRSRSTAVALVLTVQELWEAGFEGIPLVQAAVTHLLTLNPHAVPNAHVLRLGLELIVPKPLPATLAQAMMADARIIANREAFILDSEEQSFEP